MSHSQGCSTAAFRERILAAFINSIWTTSQIFRTHPENVRMTACQSHVLLLSLFRRVDMGAQALVQLIRRKGLAKIRCFGTDY